MNNQAGKEVISVPSPDKLPSRETNKIEKPPKMVNPETARKLGNLGLNGPSKDQKKGK